MSQTSGVDMLSSVTEEAWDFGDMNIPDDLYWIWGTRSVQGAVD